MILTDNYEQYAKSIIQSDTSSLTNIPCGTHICGFYQCLDDLINMLAPYYKFGLENNEYCIWVTSEPISNKKAKLMIRNHIPNLDHYLKKGQMEIISYSEWYLPHGKFDGDNVINSWIKKIDEAVAKGYKGIRVSGNTTWLKKEDWPAFQNYETTIDKRINGLKMIAICTYQISKCTSYEIIDTVKNHKYLFVSDCNKSNIINDIARIEKLDIISKMSASIAHEIRNPLTSIRGLLQLMQEKRACVEYTTYFNIMFEEIDRINSIIGEFLSLARNKSSSLIKENLNNIINAIYPLIQADAIKNGNNIILELGNICHIQVIPEDIRQLIFNLVRNGLEAMPTGGNLTIRTYVMNGEIILEVADEGIGISPDIIDVIGSPFYTTKDTGTGFGLAICNNIAIQHNATLNFKANPKGTSFYVQFKHN
jgi:K+-sensing histidine kinase KdpD